MRNRSRADRRRCASPVVDHDRLLEGALQRPYQRACDFNLSCANTGASASTVAASATQPRVERSANPPSVAVEAGGWRAPLIGTLECVRELDCSRFADFVSLHATQRIVEHWPIGLFDRCVGDIDELVR